MKITIASSNRSLKISKAEWESIGKQAGWFDSIKNKTKELVDSYNSPSGNEPKPKQNPSDDLYFHFSVNYESLKHMIIGIQSDIDDGVIVSGNQLMEAIAKIKSSGALQEIARDVKTLLGAYPHGSKKWKSVVQKTQDIKDSINNLKSQQGISG